MRVARVGFCVANAGTVDALAAGSHGAVVERAVPEVGARVTMVV